MAIPAGLTGPSRDAYVMLQSLLNSWRLGSLAGVLANYIKQGYSSDAITYLLQQTPQYQQRFAANAQRVKNGLAPLSPADYLSAEEGYFQALRAAGVPPGFYDKYTDFQGFIASDVSPNEVAKRAQDAMSFVLSTDPNARNALKAYYGIDTSHLVAHFLDPKAAEPILAKQAAAAQIAGAALDQGLGLTNRTSAERFADMGVTQQQAQNAYQQIGMILPQEQQIASHFGQQYTQSTAENEFLGGLASAQRARQQLNQNEEALFAGDGAVKPVSLGISPSY